MSPNLDQGLNHSRSALEQCVTKYLFARQEEEELRKVRMEEFEKMTRLLAGARSLRNEFATVPDDGLNQQHNMATVQENCHAGDAICRPPRN